MTTKFRLPGTLLLFVGFALPVYSQDMEGWKTLFATPADVSTLAPRAVLEGGKVHIRAGNGVYVPQPGSDGALRARLHFLPGMANPQLRIRRNVDGNMGESTFYNLIFFIDNNRPEVKSCSLLHTTPGKTKELRRVELPKPFKQGEEMDLELSAVGDRLKLLINGREVMDLKDASISAGAFWGLATGDAWFSRVQMRSLTPDGLPTYPWSVDHLAIPKENAAMMRLHTECLTAIQRDATVPYLEAVKSLNAKYLAALDRALDAATQAARLEDALAIRDEQKRVTDGLALPAAEPAALKPLLTTYRTALSGLDSARDQKCAGILKNYDKALDGLIAERLRASDLDGALIIKKVKEEVTKRLALPAASAAPGQPK